MGVRWESTATGRFHGIGVLAVDLGIDPYADSAGQNDFNELV
jgi:hypothetical protein